MPRNKRRMNLLCMLKYCVHTQIKYYTAFMKFRHFFICLAASTFLLASCADGLDVFEAPASPYAGASVQDPVTKDLKVRVDQKYRTTNLTLKELGLAPAADAVFYAPYDETTDWCGEDWYSAEYGFYMTGSGKACQRSAEDAKFFVEYYPAGVNGVKEATVAIGQIPDACEVGKTYTLEFGFATAETKQPVKISVKVAEALPWAVSKEHEDGLTYTVYQEVNTDYTALEIPINEKAVKAALGLDSIKPLLDAMQSDTAYDTTMRGYEPDGTYDDYNKYTANVAGYWFNQDGYVCEWKGEKWGAFIEWDRTSPMIFRLGQAVENNVVGSRYDMKIALIHDGKEAILTFKLMIVSEVTDDLGLL